MQNNSAIWQNTAMIVERVNQLEDGLQQLHVKAALQNSITTGVSAMRKAKYAQLAKNLITVQDALWVYATGTNNFELAARNRMAPSTIKGLSIGSRLIRMDVIESDMTTYGAFLTDYGVSAELLTTLTAQIADYRSIAYNPRQAIIDRKTISYEIDQLSTSLSRLLRDDLDRMVRMFSGTYPLFVVTYFNARLLVNLNGKTPRLTDSSEPENDIGS
jgi:hypothetical protein